MKSALGCARVSSADVRGTPGGRVSLDSPPTPATWPSGQTGAETCGRRPATRPSRAVGTEGHCGRQVKPRPSHDDTPHVTGEAAMSQLAPTGTSRFGPPPGSDP
jgi:hypothetical protein